MALNSRVGVRLIKMGAIYMIIGLGIAIFMVAAKDRVLSTVHSHVILLGWMTMGITGLVYRAIPACAGSRLAGWHFWLHSIGLPVMMLSLGFQEYGHTGIEPITAISSIMILVALLLFTINVCTNLKVDVE